MRTRAGGARRRRRALRRCRSTALQTLAAATPATATRCRWRSAARCARPAQLDEAIQAFERAAALVPIAAGQDSPHAQIAAIALEKKDHAARDRRADGARRGRLRQRRGRARSWPALLRQASVDRRRRSCGRSTSGSPRSIRSTPRRTRCSAASRCSATTPTPPRASSATVARARTRSTAPPPTPIWPRAISRRGKTRRRARSRRWPRSRSRPSYERAQDLLLKLVGGAAVSRGGRLRGRADVVGLR